MDISLHVTTVNRTAAYSAPEAMTGVVSKASDWWSVGVISLELLIGRHPFAGLDERAVNFQLVTRGIELPSNLPPDWALLIKGLLTRDHAKRWASEQIRAWLEGRRNVAVHYTAAAAAVIGQKPYRFQGREYGDAASLAVALAEQWEDGVKHWGRGYVLQWIEKQLEDQHMAVRLHDVQDDAGLKSLELQLTAVVLVMNAELPLNYKGQLVTLDWLGRNWEAAQQVLDSSLPQWLKALRDDAWLADAVQRWQTGMSFLRSAGVPFYSDSAGRLLASGNRTVVDGLVAERRTKYSEGRKENLTALMRKEPLDFQESVLVATVLESQLRNPEEILVEESLEWLDQQGVNYDRKEATHLIIARDWAELTPRWEARRQRVWMAKSPTLEKALSATTPEYLEAVLGATAGPDSFWADAFEKGNAYLHGKDVKANPEMAVRWLQQGASEGDARAQYALGICYHVGFGVAEDKAEAARWYGLAAEQGLANAQTALGFCYEHGNGVGQDKAEAARWYRLAAEQGDGTAQYNLSFCYYKGEGVGQDKAEAVRWLLLAAEQGLANAQNSLGFCYDAGEGVSQNKAEAVRWYRLAAEKGLAQAQNTLAFCYNQGDGVTQNKAEAVRWYRLAAEQGFAQAQYNLGVCYFDGEGVTHNKAEALRWYGLAAEQGHAEAQKYLGLTNAQNKA
jgi:TPR repeat protein